MTLQFSYKHNKLNYQLLYILSIVQRDTRYTVFVCLFLFLCTGTETNLQKVICILGISEARKKAYFDR